MKRTFDRAQVTNLDRLLEVADREAEIQLGGPVDRTITDNGGQIEVEWTARLQQKLQATIPRIQSAQVIATALNEKSMSITGASHASVSLKQMLADRKAKLAAAQDKLSANLGKLDQATAALDSLGSDVGTEADDLLASVGQFKNDLGG